MSFEFKFEIDLYPDENLFSSLQPTWDANHKMVVFCTNSNFFIMGNFLDHGEKGWDEC